MSSSGGGGGGGGGGYRSNRYTSDERGRENKAGFVGMDGFGASAPAEVLYEHFGITAQAVAEKVKSLL